MYTIKILDQVSVPKVLAEIKERLELHGLFTTETRIKNNCIELPKVRLIDSEPYYGNTPDAENQPRWGYKKPPRFKYLSWSRWITFNALINDILDYLECSANVWSRPQSLGKTLWIRKEGTRRETYSWEPDWNGFRLFAKINDGKDDPNEFGSDITLKFPNLSDL